MCVERDVFNICVRNGKNTCLVYVQVSCDLFRFVTYITISRLFQYNYFVSLLQLKPYNALPASDFVRKPPTIQVSLDPITTNLFNS